MRRVDFHFELPERLIAQHPLAERSASRLLCLDGPGGRIADRHFTDLTDLLRAGDLLVVNDTRVIPARLFGVKASGGRVEILVERILGARDVLAQIRASKTPKPGAAIRLDDGTSVEVCGRRGALFELRFDGLPEAVMEAVGRVPLPPYIRREDDAADATRYQTVYADKPGAVAAPTAGLHFDRPLLDRLEAAGVGLARVTLHVGAGTFAPVRVDDISHHRMHAERAVVSASVCRAVREARARGGRVVAVGTTAVRSLEAAAAGGELAPFDGETALFITPGYRFGVVDALVTNFHLPESTLLMLVSAFAGHRAVMAAYRHAVENEYRFFSYGDAMFLTRAEARRDETGATA